MEALEGNNLIFVDEGHKGSGGKAWREVRERLGETGFTFEYSATFGQALAAANNRGPANRVRQGHRVRLFPILTSTATVTARLSTSSMFGRKAHPDFTDKLLLANSLSFYQQQLAYAEQFAELREYNIEKPLWIFVGNTVQQRENDDYRSDVLTVVRFLHRFLHDRKWAVGGIRDLLDGRSGLVATGDGQDLFAESFKDLRDRGGRGGLRGRNPQGDCTVVSGGLQLCDLRSEGELGPTRRRQRPLLRRPSTSETRPGFKTLVRNSIPAIDVQDDALQGSLFAGINDPHSRVQVLAGSRKFMEGWSSWRVSNMGLLNIGRGEGSQIIQLFGRGVRLKGRGMSLKRSTPSTTQKHPPRLDVLEKLNIFALKADYMAQFQEFLGNEGIDTRPARQWQLRIQTNDDFLKPGFGDPAFGRRRGLHGSAIPVAGI